MKTSWVVVLLLSLFCSVYAKAEGYKIGINYGQLGTDLPEPEQVVSTIQGMGFGSVKIYNANPRILKALGNTSMEVTVMVPNEEIAQVAGDQKLANSWVEQNVAPFYPRTRINTVLVGNEVLSDYKIADNTWPYLVPAMKAIRKALVIHGLRHIKVGTTCAMDVLSESFPPSSGAFRPDVAESVMRPMLNFLNKTKSYFHVDAYPYFAWASNPSEISLDYAMFGPSSTNIVDPNSGLVYTNMLDQQLDSMVSAMAKLGYTGNGIRLAIAETGWPTKGDNVDGATVANAALYTSRLVKKMVAYPPVGTPMRPNQFIPTFIFSLFNENLKGGAETERNWGLLYPDSTPVYNIVLNGV